MTKRDITQDILDADPGFAFPIGDEETFDFERLLWNGSVRLIDAFGFSVAFQFKDRVKGMRDDEIRVLRYGFEGSFSDGTPIPDPTPGVGDEIFAPRFLDCTYGLFGNPEFASSPLCFVQYVPSPDMMI